MLIMQSLLFQQLQVLFHSLFRVLLIFPLRYLFAIGLPQPYLALGGVYLPALMVIWIQAALSSNPTLRQLALCRNPRALCIIPLPRSTPTGLSPSLVHLSRWQVLGPLRPCSVLGRVPVRHITWWPRSRGLRPFLPFDGLSCAGGRPRFSGLGYSLFTRRYYGNHGCFLFLPLLRCFNSGGFLP